MGGETSCNPLRQRENWVKYFSEQGKKLWAKNRSMCLVGFKVKNKVCNSKQVEKYFGQNKN